MNWQIYAEHVIERLQKYDKQHASYYAYYLRVDEQGIVALASALEQANRELMWVPIIQSDMEEPHAK